MEFKIFENVYVEANFEAPNEVVVSQHVKNAITFFRNALNIQVDNIKVKIVLSESYSQDINKFHFQAQPEHIEEESNGQFIAVIYQNPDYKINDLPIIVINWGKLKTISQLAVESVIVHELVHYFDYCFTYPESIEPKYGNVLEGFPNGSFEDKVGGGFGMRSELRAKLYQEKYLLENGTTFNERYMSIKIESYLSNNKEWDLHKAYYNVSHARALLLSWEFYIKNRLDKSLREPFQKYINDTESRILKIEEDNRLTDFSKLIELDEFYKFYDCLER